MAGIGEHFGVQVHQLAQALLELGKVSVAEIIAPVPAVEQRIPAENARVFRQQIANAALGMPGRVQHGDLYPRKRKCLAVHNCFRFCVYRDGNGAEARAFVHLGVGQLGRVQLVDVQGM